MAARPHRWRRALGWGLLALLLSLSALAGYAWLGWQRLQQLQGLAQLDWQAASLGRDGLRLQRLSLEQRGADGQRLQLQAEGLLLAWRLRLGARPALNALQIEHLQLDWQPGGTPASDAVPLQLADLQPPAWLAGVPRRLRIDRLDARLPCASGRCTLQGRLTLEHGGAALLPLTLDLTLQRQTHQARLQAVLGGRPDDLAAQLSLALDDRAPLQLHSRLRAQADGPHWQGELQLPALPELDWLHAWAGEWLALADLPPIALPRQLQARAEWQLQLPAAPLAAASLLRSHGPLRLDLQLTQPWRLAGVGHLHGALRLDLFGADGAWQARQLHADLQLAEPEGDWLQALPAALRPQALQLRLQPLDTGITVPPPGATAEPAPLALQLALSARGALNLELHAALQALLRPDWRLQLHDARLQVDAARLTLAALDARALRAELQFDAQLDARHLAARLRPASTLQLGRLTLADAGLQLEQLRGELAGLQLQLPLGEAPEGSARLHGPLRLAAQLQHAQLRPQGWRWQGRLDTDLASVRLDGLLDNDAGLRLDSRLQRSAAGALALRAQLAALELAGDNPLARSFSAWPALLEASAGRLSGQASLQLGADGRPRGAFALRLNEAAGIYDRSELHGLQARLLGELHGDELELELAELRLAQLNPGLALGPLQLRASYQARLDTPLAGRLQLWQADSALLGGSLSAGPARLDLAQPSQRLTLQLRGLELAELLAVYPAEGLSGSGRLDGQLPLRIDAAGLHVEAGRLAARAPGGVLQLHSERISAFGRSNPALQLATTALEDFRYDRLESDVSYDPQGQLLLALRLHGSNPALEGGRPVNLTINLEENLPSLLTSLQLGGRVNEAIQRRVQQGLPPRP